ncbi:MAG TPA: DUF190 domain-containing protein [Tepidisphaeraceae bacterium]|nr:DUF190 domain-containing protein [Tepidisphaeraceae bacterium]
MNLVGEQVLLRIYLQSADRAPYLPTFERIIKAARSEKMAGATVLRGILGAGYHGLLQGSPWSLARHEPIIVEIVDTPEKIARFVHEQLDQIMVGGMLTLERASVMMYRASSGFPVQPQPSAPPAAPLQLAGMLQPLSTLPQIQPGPHMKTQENGVLVRVFIGESDRFEDKPLYEKIVLKVRELGLAGATVLRGTEGFGAHSILHTNRLLAMSSDLPIVIEIVDSEDKIKLLLPHLETMVKEGLITMEYVAVLLYRHGEADKGPAGG